ncbi:TPA_asm: hypothetical protein vir520_00045 [Caudoviricetes sp. vir520]|nr:TPA_asm: hypothetical protein vir520_00045 [Caudoviricetes sp. vir520]
MDLKKETSIEKIELVIELNKLNILQYYIPD